MIFSYCTHPMEGYVALNETGYGVLLPYYTDQYLKPCRLTLQIVSMRTYYPSTMYWSDILKQLRCAVQAKYDCPRLWIKIFRPSGKGKYYITSERDQAKIELVLKHIIKEATRCDLDRCCDGGE